MISILGAGVKGPIYPVLYMCLLLVEEASARGGGFTVVHFSVNDANYMRCIGGSGVSI